MKKALVVLMAITLAATTQAAALSWGGTAHNIKKYAGSGTLAPQTPEADWPDDAWAAAGTVYNMIFLGNFAEGSTPSDSQITWYNKDTGMTNLGGQILSTFVMSDQNEEDGSFGDNDHQIVLRSDAGTPEVGIDGDMRPDGSAWINGWWMCTMYDATTPEYFDAHVFEMTGSVDNPPSSNSADDFLDNETYTIGDHMRLGVIPEPATAALLALGLAAFGLKRKTRA